MNPTLNDIRILKLAQMYETAYEGFLRDVAIRLVDDAGLKRRLSSLADADHAGRLEAQLARLSAGLRPSDEVGLQRAALLDVRDIEAAAERFFQDHADRVHDPLVAALFRAIADEERGHVRIAQEILDAFGAEGVGREAQLVGTIPPPDPRPARSKVLP